VLHVRKLKHNYARGVSIFARVSPGGESNCGLEKSADLNLRLRRKASAVSATISRRELTLQRLVSLTSRVTP